MIVVSGCPRGFSRSADDWITIDLGFAGRQSNGKVRRSTGLRIPEYQTAKNVTYGEAIAEVLRTLRSAVKPINLMLEAPLSIAFDKKGNPAPRRFEQRDKSARYWYLQGGAVTLIAAAQLIARLERAEGPEVRLFEAFLTFKTQSQDHKDDADRMLDAALNENPLENHEMRQHPQDQLESSTARFGMNFGIPPVFDISAMK
ncbi:MAG: hypothetical protein AAF511_11805 [Pseudomonadota bacterium]